MIPPRSMHKPSDCNNDNSTQQYLFWVLNDYRLQQPRTSFPTSTSADQKYNPNLFLSQPKGEGYHKNKENTYTFWNTNARYCITWEYADLLIEFSGWRRN